MAANLRSWFFEERLRALKEISDAIDHVTTEEIIGLLQSLHIQEKMATVALGPRSEDELFGAVAAGS
jgi:predicted Zn-dependent peptidase